MQTYSEYRPTEFDCKGLALPDRQDWIVAPVIQTRDSGAESQSNFAAALNRLGGESATVEVHRFGHWGPGWFEIILAHPSLSAKVQDIESALEDYALLDEDDLSRREHEEYLEAWEHWLPHDFAAALKEELGLSDDTEWLLWDGPIEPLRALYEELTPSGDYWQDNHMGIRLESAAKQCSRERMAQYLTERRKEKRTA